MGVFREYDVRGIYPSELSETLAYRIGRALVLYLKSKKVVVGRDCRLSSSALAKSLIYGITDQGADVIDAGLSSTPCIYFASKKHDSVMVTASHNPPKYNGLKITGKGIKKISLKDGLKDIEALVLKNRFPASKRKGSVTAKHIIPDYAKKIRSLTNVKIKPLKVLFDAGNGMAGVVVPEILKGLPIKYKILYKKPNGEFPNHLADPVKPKNTAELQKEVVKGRYDLGVAYDVDCDRVGFIDEKGNRVRSEHAFLLFADLINARKVVKSVNCSRIINDIEARVYTLPVGSANIGRAMKKYEADLGVEVSGHFFFKKLWYIDSGDAALMMMLAVLSRSQKKLSDLVAPYVSKYETSDEINFKVKDPDETLKKIENNFCKAKISKLDGVSIDTGKCWFNIRRSKNEPLLRLNAEALTKKDLKDCIRKVKSLT